ncbi:unnamed protein product [Arabidopsis halleri]
MTNMKHNSRAAWRRFDKGLCAMMWRIYTHNKSKIMLKKCYNMEKEMYGKNKD